MSHKFLFKIYIFFNRIHSQKLKPLCHQVVNEKQHRMLMEVFSFVSVQLVIIFKLNETYLSLIFLAFGIGSMIYIGLEIGSFFEVPFLSPCHEILRGVNPLLQMIFTFMQMYFIFMNSRVKVKEYL